jgi:hypothetical protein
MAQASVKDLHDFINVAVNGRKYPENTAHGLKSALKLFEAELTAEEASSLELFRSNLPQIYNSVYGKNKLKYSPNSLLTYKKRVSKLLGDYEKYGTDPTKMANWNPKTIQRAPRHASQASRATTSEPSRAQTDYESLGVDMAPPRTLPSGVVVIFPKSLDVSVSFGEFGNELKQLDQKAVKLKGDNTNEQEGLS